MHPPSPDPERLAAVVRADLRAMNAADAKALVPGAPTRELVSVAPMTLPYSGGRVLRVPIALAPARLRVPTELGLHFRVVLDPAGAPSVEQRPAREDLAAATRLALDGELRALQLATEALERSGTKPPGRSWAAALRTARLDPRLPAGQLHGEPMWHLMFDPWIEEDGGWRSVLISLPGFTVTSVNGRPP